MDKLIKEVTEMIGSRLSRGSVNLIRMENFESPEIYMKVCSNFLSMSDKDRPAEEKTPEAV